jgi:hypothetical protein
MPQAPKAMRNYPEAPLSAPAWSVRTETSRPVKRKLDDEDEDTLRKELRHSCLRSEVERGKLALREEDLRKFEINRKLEEIREKREKRKLEILVEIYHYLASHLIANHRVL